MPQAFLSHSSKDKRIVKEVGVYLNKCFIKVWLDIDELSAGASLSGKIQDGIDKSNFFVVFISNNFLKSSWCVDEFDRAHPGYLKERWKILPVLLQPHSELDFGEENSRASVIKNFLDRTKYVEIDEYNTELGMKAVADAIWKDESIRFEPIQVKEIDGQEVQLIQFRLQGALESNFLESWDFDIESFLSLSDEKRHNKPIISNIPIAINGRGPIWIYAAIIVPLNNLFSLFIYNNPDGAYICTYSLSKDDMYGRVLKANK